MDQQAFEALLAKANAMTAAQPQQPDTSNLFGSIGQAADEVLVPNDQTQQPTAQTADPSANSPSGAAAVPGPGEPDYSQPPTGDKPLGDPSGTDALAGGALKGIFETKDFLFGEPEEKSQFRQNVEQTVDLRGSQSMIDGFSAGVAQFAIGMIGLGKAKYAAEGISAVEKGFKVLEATKKGRTALEATKAATVGAVAFDPYAERLSNLVQDTPLANPLTNWLAASPDDSAAEGRVKAALESIGLDATIMGVFLGSTKILKALKAGDSSKAAKLVDDFQAEQAKAVEAEQVGQLDAEAIQQPQIETPALPGASETAQAEAVPGSEKPTVPAAEPVGDPIAPKAAESAASLDDIAVDVVDTPTQAAQQAGVDLSGNPTPSAKPKVKFTDENTTEVLDGMKSDVDAIEQHGGWYEAIEAGHTFGKGEGIPYVKLNSDAAVDDFMARATDAAQERLDTIKGGDVLSDAKVQKLIDQRVALYDEDPALLLGMIQQSGANASRMVADMEAGYLVSARMFQDTHALAVRIKMGDFAEFGGKDQAVEALKHRLSLATSVYGAARSITANAGRGVRRMKREFAVDPEAVKNLAAMDGDRLIELVNSSGGNPRNMAKLTNSTLLGKTIDFAQFLLVNNLVSGPKTQLINIMTNGYMVGVRPLERILGSVLPAAEGDVVSRQILKESLKQYAYMGSAFTDAWGTAIKAFTMNDSVLAPHRTEYNVGNQGVQALTPQPVFKPWNSTANLLSNVFTIATSKDAAAKAAITTIGLPTRTLGAVDELVKQTVYRSKIMANAHIEAVEEATNRGLEGDAAKAFVKSFVTKAHEAAFDAEGRALDTGALREAQIATFQQDLLPGTLGKTMQSAASNFAPLKLVLPFIKTPTNVIRYGWKMTPGLNMLQGEYRNMLKGNYGAEAKAQAIGQMGMGSLFMGTAAFLVSNGSITGGGPRDFKQRTALMATGWQSYSLVTENEDGSKTYVPFGRLDPVAIPFGIIADLQNAIHNLGEGGEENADVGAVVGALGLALARQFTDKTYLTSLKAFTDALSDPERSAGRTLSTTAANFIPFSALQRQVNPDPYMREARGFADKLMSTIPGLSESVPAKYDAWGEPIVTRKGLWTSDEDQDVDREVQRLVLEGGSTVVSPSPNQNGVDLRDIVLSTGENAFEKYQQLAGKPSPGAQPLKKQVARIMKSDAYKRAPDGDAVTKGTKLWLLHPVMDKYRSVAMKLLKRDPVIREAFGKRDAEVRAAYQAQRGKTKARDGGLGEVGEAFGVDLNALDNSTPKPSAPIDIKALTGPMTKASGTPPKRSSSTGGLDIQALVGPIKK